MSQKIIKISVLLITAIFILGACSSESTGEKSSSSEPIEQPEVSTDWEAEVKNIIESENSKRSQLDKVYMYADEYTPQEGEVDTFFDDLVSEYRNGTFKENVKEPLYASTVHFKTEVAMDAFEETNETKAKFLFDLYQINKYIYREVDTFDSPDTLVNLEQIEDTLAELGL